MAASLWDPIRIGGLKVRNRTVMPAMGTGYASLRGEVTPRLLAYLRRRAEGGVGLIITEICAVHPLGRTFQRQLGIYEESFLPGLSELASVVKREGAAVAAQLHHAGRETFPQVIGGQPVAPSPIPSRATRQVPRELTLEEIAELIGCYARAARMAREAGFDAVEVHGAHGYLVNQFVSPYSNARQDQYGGDDEGRFRFARQLVQEIKREAGRDFPVIFRFSASEEVRGGYDLDYILPLIQYLEEDGVDAFHVSCGVIDSPGNPTCPGLHHPAGINVERSARVKQVVRVPVIVVGKLHDLDLAEEVVSGEKADMVAFGRQHLADPHFLRKALEGRREDIRTCLSCNQGCIERMAFELQPITCSINPDCGEEWRDYRGLEADRGPFLVLGAGPAGLQAAITLREAGAEVRVVEKEGEAGGQLRAASRPPGKEPYAAWVEWALRRLDGLGVSVETGRRDWKKVLGEKSWKGVVAACGADPVIPPVPGCELGVNAEARQVLLGEAEVGENVLVVGAGAVGMETAYFLLERGHRVVVAEESEVPPLSPLTSHGYHLHRQLRKRGLLLLGARVVEVLPDRAVLEQGGERKELPVDSVVWAVGSRPETQAAREAEERGLRVYVPGDAAEPRRLLEAIHEGNDAARRLLYGDDHREKSRILNDETGEAEG